ncbi:8762_t:CDS:1 [Dentiscutata erythropus]|uniref:8762_t:CDS:1 n=1 Tax=Dentiscutata erythropus TaxID=1348616 RepID=A0A9N9IHH0_9GLOM|nr:8762_t:CDS:1 [Dentiscutata erythropus]
MRIGNYKLANDDQKEKKSGIKEKLQTDKIHFDLVASDKDSIIYCKKKHNKYSIHNHLIVKYEDYLHLSKEEFMKNTITNFEKNLQFYLAICRCSYDDLIDFSKCIWCNLDCCSQRILARYDENSDPFDYSITQTVNNNKSGKN